MKVGGCAEVVAGEGRAGTVLAMRRNQRPQKGHQRNNDYPRTRHKLSTEHAMNRSNKNLFAEAAQACLLFLYPPFLARQQKNERVHWHDEAK